MKKFDFVIIGAGIIGTAIARELALRKAGSIALLEKEPALARHASGRNSGVIHSGINQKPGSLKARMCVEGSRLLRDYCRAHQIPMHEDGTLVIARNRTEEESLETLLQMALAAGVPDVKILNRTEFLKREPLANGGSALFSPTGATVDPVLLLHSVSAEARARGVELFLENEVRGINESVVKTNREQYQAGHLINCAGLYADKIARMLGAGKAYRILPFRGEYREVEGCPIHSMIYPAPDLRFPFLSIHLTREPNGKILAGPSAVLAFGREAYERQWDFKEMFQMFSSPQFLGLLRNSEFREMAMLNARTCISQQAFLKEIQSLITLPIKPEQLKPYRSGIRAQMVDNTGKFVDDILIEHQPHATHVLNGISPGMTCSLAFARDVAGRILASDFRQFQL